MLKILAMILLSAIIIFLSSWTEIREHYAGCRRCYVKDEYQCGQCGDCGYCVKDGLGMCIKDRNRAYYNCDYYNGPSEAPRIRDFYLNWTNWRREGPSGRERPSGREGPSKTDSVHEKRDHHRHHHH